MITWQQVVTSPRFQKLSEPEKRKVQQSFFDQYVAPVAAENGYDLEQVGKQFNERATSLWYTPPEPVPTASPSSGEMPDYQAEVPGPVNTPVNTQPVKSGSLGKDTINLLGRGAVSTAESAADFSVRLPEVLGLPGKLLSIGAKKIRDATAGNPDEAFTSYKDFYTQNLSPEQKAAGEKKWWDSEKGTFGEAWSDPRAYYGGVVESLPGTIVSMAPSLSIAKAAYAGQLAKGIAPEVAGKAAAKAATIAGAFTEGALGAGQSGAEVRQIVNKLSPEVLAQSEAFQNLVRAGNTPEEAKRLLAEDASALGFALGGIATGVFGGMGDRFLAKAFTSGVSGNIVSRTLKGAVAEGLLEEFPQSYLQKVGENIALKKANPNQSLFDDALNQGLGGLATGATMGAGMGAASRREQSPATTSPTSSPTSPPTPAPSPQAAAQEILSQPSASTVPLTGDLKADLDAINNAPITPLESLAAAFKTAQLNPIEDFGLSEAPDATENATQPIPVSTPAGVGAQADNLVNAGNNDLARVDIAPTGILAQAPAVEGNPLPPNQTQAGQTAQGATDNTRSLEQASQDQQITNPSIGGASQAILPENAQPAQGSQPRAKSELKSDTVAIAEKARMQAAQDGAAAFASGVQRQLPAEYAAGFSSPAGRARGKAWFQGWDQANAGAPVGGQDASTGLPSNNTDPATAGSVVADVVESARAGAADPRSDVVPSDNAASPQFRDLADSKGRIKTFANEKSAKLYLRGNKSTLRGYTPRKDGKEWVLSKPVKAKSEKQLRAEEQRRKDSTTPYPERDNLWTAIAKLGGLNKKEAVSTWGSDPRQYRASHVYNRPVLSAVYIDKDDQQRGLSLDDMGQKLAELGYLPKDENGKYNLADFEEAFKNGDEHYTPTGHERRAAKSDEARYQEEMAKYRESAMDAAESTPEAENLDADTLDAALEIADDLADDLFFGPGNTTEIDAMRALGFTDEEINEATTAYNQARQSEARETTDQEAPASPESGAGTSQESPTEVTPQTPADAGVSVSGLEPWQMTSAQWNKERDAIRPDFVQSKFTRASASEAVSAINRLNALTYGVTDEASQKLKAAQRGELSLSPDELEAITDRLQTRVTHQDVIEKALREGKPVPANVLLEYPDLEAQSAPEIGNTPETRANQAFPINAKFYYADGNKGMTSSGTFTADKSRWITFTLAEAQRMVDGEIKPYGATREGLFVSTENNRRLTKDLTNKETNKPTETRADAGEPTPMQAAADKLAAAAEKMAAAAEAFTLGAQTRDELQAKADADKAAAEAKAKADREAAEKEAKDNERKIVQNRMEGANADFQLGQSAEDNLSGQNSLFDSATESAQYTAQYVEQFKDLQSQGFQGDLFATAGNAAPNESTRSEVSRDAQPTTPVFVKLKKTGEIRVGVDRVTNAKDAAHVFAGIRKSPRENFVALILDKDQKPISYLKLFSGTLTQTSVYPRELATAAYQTPGAASIWISHNHPSGIPKPSAADINLTKVLNQSFGDGLSVQMAGHVVVAGTKASELDSIGVSNGFTFDIPAYPRNKTIPVTERASVRVPKIGEKLSNPSEVKTAVKSLLPTGEGMIMVTAQNNVMAVVPMTAAQMGKLRGTGEYETLVRKVGEINASGVILVLDGAYNDTSQSSMNKAVRNMASALDTVDVRILDVIARDDDRLASLASQGADFDPRGAFFSRGAQAQSIDPTDAKAAVEVIKSKWKNAPKINVWESFDQAPAGLRDEIERADAQDARGAWFADEIHLFPQNIPNLAVLERTVIHESRHAGLDGAFGRDLNPVLMNLYLKNAELRREVNALQKKTGLNTVNQINEVLADKPLDYAKKLSGWKQVVGKMKEWFEKNGFTRLAAMLDGPTADELVKDVLYQAEEFIRSGKKSTTLTGGAMFDMGSPINRLADFWQKYASRDDAFRYAKSDSKSIEGIVKDLDAKMFTPEMKRRDYKVLDADFVGETDGELLPTLMAKTEDGKDAEFATLNFDPGGNGKSLFIRINDTDRFKRGADGARAYQVMMTWAVNNGYQLNPDSELLPVNRLRRTEAQISMMLKYDSRAGQIAPHEEQYIGLLSDSDFADTMSGKMGGIAPDDVREKLKKMKDRLWKNPELGTTREEKREIFTTNLENLLIASAALTERRVKALADLTVNDGQIRNELTNELVIFDPESKTDLERLESVRKASNLGKVVVFTRGSETGVGETTASRAVYTSSVLSRNVPWSDLFRNVAAKSDQRLSNPQERNGLLALGGEGLVSDSRVQAALDALPARALYSREVAPPDGGVSTSQTDTPAFGAGDKVEEMSFEKAAAFVMEMERLAKKHGKIYVRWSSSETHDLSPDARSRDYVAGASHNGLSAVPIDAKMHRVDIAKRVAEYGFLRMKDRNIKPRVYLAERTGTDSDGYALIRPTQKLMEADSDFLRAIDGGFAKSLELNDSIQDLERRIPKVSDAIGKQLLESSLQEKRQQLKAIIGTQRQAPPSEGLGTSGANQTQTPAFRKWFGDSVVTDNGKPMSEGGKPLVVYHGSSASFDVFDIGRLNSRNEGPGFYFTTNKDVARGYVNRKGNSGQLVEAYLSLQKPMPYSTDPFNTATLQKLVTRIAEIESNDQGIDVRDGFLANYGDTYASGVKGAAREAANLIASDESAVDQISGIVGSGVSPEYVLRAVTEVTGYDGIVASGFSNAGDLSNTIYVAFRPKQIKSAVGNRGTFDASNPDIRFSRTRDDNIKSANAAAEYGIAKVTRMALGQKMIKEIVSNPGQFNVINKTLNTQLHKALKNKEFGKVFWAGQQFMEDVSQLASQAAELAPEILPNYGNIKNLGMALRDTVNPLKSRQRNKDIKAAGAAIFDGTMEGGGNPLEGRIFTDKELSDAKLTPEAITFYKQARQVIDKSLDDLSMSEVVRMLGERVKIEPAMMEFLKSNPNQFRAGLLDAIATARENAAPEMVPGWKDIEKRAQETFQHADALKAAGYAPLMRFGKYFVTVREEGETIYRAHYENRLDLNAAMAELKAKYPRSEVSKGTISEKDFKLMKGMTPETIMLFAEKLGLPMDMQKAAQQYYREAVSARSAMKRRIERKGIAGYSDDLPRVLAGFVTSNARRAAANYNMPIIKGAIDNIDQDAGDIRDEAMEMVEQIESPTEDAAALRGLMYAYFIGGSMASAIVNMTQPLTMTLPYLGQWGNAKASAALAKALRTSSKLPQNLKDALKLANEKGITDPQEVYYLYQETIRGISSNRTFQKGMGLWSAMFSIAENLNRRTTFLAAYDMWESADAKTRAEMTKVTGAKDGFDFANRTVQETQGIYNKGNRPNWARGAIGATLMTFKQYTVAYLELLSRLPPQQKMVMLAMLVFLSGLGGLPGEEDAEDLIDTIGQAMGYNTNSKMFIRQKVADLIGETFMPIVMQGVSGMPGFPADIGGRLGMANILPATSLLKRSESNSTDKEIAEAIGPIAGIVKNFNNAKKAAESGEWFDAMANAAPNAIGNALKGAKIGQTGEMTDYKDRKTVDGLDMSHAFFKFIGFNPKPVADQGRISRMIGQDVRLLKDVEADIADKLARAIKNGDDEKQERALAELDEWNEKNPDTPIVITRQQINRRIEEMQTSRDIRQMKTIPKESRAYYMENVK